MRDARGHAQKEHNERMRTHRKACCGGGAARLREAAVESGAQLLPLRRGCRRRRRSRRVRCADDAAAGARAAARAAGAAARRARRAGEAPQVRVQRGGVVAQHRGRARRRRRRQRRRRLLARRIAAVAARAAALACRLGALHLVTPLLHLAHAEREGQRSSVSACSRALLHSHTQRARARLPATRATSAWSLFLARWFTVRPSMEACRSAVLMTRLLSRRSASSSAAPLACSASSCTGAARVCECAVSRAHMRERERIRMHVHRASVAAGLLRQSRACLWASPPPWPATPASPARAHASAQRARWAVARATGRAPAACAAASRLQRRRAAPPRRRASRSGPSPRGCSVPRSAAARLLSAAQSATTAEEPLMRRPLHTAAAAAHVAPRAQACQLNGLWRERRAGAGAFKMRP
jgi:hypothetical protein